MTKAVFDRHGDEVGTFDGNLIRLNDGSCYELNEGAFYAPGDAGGSSFIGLYREKCVTTHDGQVLFGIGKTFGE